MAEVFRLKVAARRQVTLPQRVLDLLRLGEGDVLELVVHDDGTMSVRGLKLVPTNLFTDEILAQLRQREAEISEGLGLEASSAEELLKKKSTHATSSV